jgi:protein gp37
MTNTKPSRSMGATAIEWTDGTWNPVTGCDKVSPGCDHCYAERIASRGGKGFPNGFALTLHPERLNGPLRDRRPKRIFVNSMSDLFHDGIPDDYIAKVFAVMAEADWHTFQVLTKRAGRMRSWVRRHQPDPLPNVWLGVSAEDQHWADIRVPVLLDTAASVRFVSAEPLLAPISFNDSLSGLDWVIVGGESGPGHRPMDAEWVRGIRDQCTAAGVAFLFKQWGGRTPKAGGRELDGCAWDQYPDTIGEEVSKVPDDVDRSDELREWYAEDNPDGARLLDDLHAFLARFVVYPSEHHRNAHTLWIAHCWWMDCWDSTPRIAFLSPEPGSGKSRALEVTDPLVPRPVHAVNTSAAYLFRKVSDPLGRPTILYDECDTLWGPRAKEHEEVRAIINSGHRKGAVAGRCVVRGKVIDTEELPSYAAVALAGLDDLPDTLMSRSVVVRMKRRAPAEPVEPWRRRVNGSDAAELYKRLLDWSTVATPLQEGWPDMPAGVEDRDADVWEALLAVADLAGGHWPQTARAAAVAIVADSRVSHPSLGVRLLEDIRTVFRDDGRDLLPTADLLAALNDMETSPWAVIRKGNPLNAHSLANRLARYGIGPTRTATLRGYARYDFTDAWSRYLSIETDTSVTDDTAATADCDEVTLVTPPMEADPDRQSLRCECGEELIHPESIRRGNCTRCFLRSK